MNSFKELKEIGVRSSEMFLRDIKSEDEANSPLDGDNETRLILPRLSPVQQAATEYATTNA